MQEGKKKIVLRCAGVFGLTLVIFCLFLMGYVFLAISELKLKIHQSKILSVSQSFSPSIIEKETSIRKNEIAEFLLFTKGSRQDDLSRKLSEEVILASGQNTYQVAKDFELPALQSNSCKQLNCIQIKTEFSQIPSAIWKGLLGTEDFRFLEHRGVDPIAIARALVVDIIALKFVQGGSTLTQQLMKNLFLSSERKLARKFKEMVYALYIENVMSKEEILTLYLNEMYWGVHQGIYLKGFYAASLAYFNKAPMLLSQYEATILVSLLKGPSFYHPKKKLERLKSRTQAVYGRLKKLNLIAKKVNDEWEDNQWLGFQKDLIQRDAKRSFQTYYQLSQNAEFLLEPYEQFVLINSFYRMKKNKLKALGDADVAIKILIASKDCSGFDCPDLFSFYSKIEREKRAAMTNEFHQVGSMLKPIVYETFTDFGWQYTDMVSTLPITLSLKSGSWKPKDYSLTSETEISLKKALQKSKNIPLIRVASEIGFDALEKALVPKIPRLKAPLREYPAQLLGAVELSMEEVFQTYNSFLKKECAEIAQQGSAFEQSILHYMSMASETTISKLAKGPLRSALIFGKTGTTNKGLDNWYFAYDGSKSYLFWFGVESNRDKQSLKLSGASTSFLVFQDFMNFRGKQVPEVFCQI